MLKLFFAFFFLYFADPSHGSISLVSNKGYVIYCPCMGRFGNQVEQLLGALGFAKKTDRTLVVPPFIAQDPNQKKPHVPFSAWFDLERLEEYHRVIEMSDFIGKVAPQVWPKTERNIYCSSHQAGKEKDCRANSGVPFAPFFAEYDVNFAGSVPYTDIGIISPAGDWFEKYPAAYHPVLAFDTPPAPYTVRREESHIQKFLEFNRETVSRVNNLIKKQLKRPYLAVHIRNGKDLEHACDFLAQSGGDKVFMASAQCAGYYDDANRKPISESMCYPSWELMVMKILSAAEEIDAASVYISYDNENILDFLDSSLKDMKKGIKLVSAPTYTDDIVVNIGAMIEADAFVGNCMSTITAFAARRRRLQGKSVDYFGIEALSMLPGRREL